MSERDNLKLAQEYMAIAYDPKRASAEAVEYLCAPDNRFIAPTTFPGVHTLQQYAEAHGKMMKEVADLHIVRYDVAIAQGDWVCLRYTAEGSHCGAPHGTLVATNQHATWTAAAMFRIRNGKLAEFIKDWDKYSMWEQLGWPTEECYSGPELDRVAQDPQRSESASVI